MSTCNWLDLQTLGSQPIMPKNLPDHWSLPELLRILKENLKPLKPIPKTAPSMKTRKFWVERSKFSTLCLFTPENSCTAFRIW
jgi:hypothetical protein